MSTHVAELEAAHRDNPSTTTWIEWVRQFIERLDPLSSPPTKPDEPEISREHLKPFMRPGVNPYGPDPW